MSSTSHSLSVSKESLRQAQTEMHRHSIFHHNKSQRPSAGFPVGLAFIVPILQGCQVVSAVSPIPFLAPAFAATVKLIKSIQAADSNRHCCIDLVKKTANYSSALREYDNCSGYDSIDKLVKKHIQDFADRLEKINERVNAVECHGTLHCIFHSSANKAALEKIAQELKSEKDLLFFQLMQAMMKEINTLHKEHSVSHDSSPSPHLTKDPQTSMDPKLSLSEESTPHHTKSAYGPYPVDYTMRMPVPDISGSTRNNYTFEAIKMPTPEPYHHHYLSQPLHYHMLS